MSASETTTVTESVNAVNTTLNYYLDPELGGHVNITPGTAGFYRRKYATHLVKVHDVNGSDEEFNLNKQGFQFYQHESAEKEFRNDDQIKAVYYPETEEWLKNVYVSKPFKLMTYSPLLMLDF